MSLQTVTNAALLVMLTPTANDACHVLFIQCDSCKEKYINTCSEECSEIVQLPIEEQRRLRKEGHTPAKSFKNRLRPRLDEYLKARNLEKIKSKLTSVGFFYHPSSQICYNIEKMLRYIYGKIDRVLFYSNSLQTIKFENQG